MDRRDFLRSGGTAVAGMLMGSQIGACKGPTDVGQTLRPRHFDQKKKHNIDIIALTGSPRQRGRTHGEALRGKIRELVGLWKECLGYAVTKRPDAYLADFMNQNRFTDAIKRWTPDLLVEVEGIAEGSGLDLPTMLAFQFMDEQWLFAMHRHYKVPFPAPGCSVVGVPRQGSIPALLAQTMDLPSLYDGYQVILRIGDGEKQTVVFTCAGLIALMGLNAAGIAVVVNAMIELDHCTTGLPVAFVVRGILRHRSHSGAVDFLRGVQHASGQTYTVGSRDAIACFECSADRAVKFSPVQESGRIWHTNHALANSDKKIWSDFLKKIPPGSPDRAFKSSRARYRALGRRLQDNSRVLQVKEIFAVLSSQDDPAFPVCRPETKDKCATMTVGSAVMALSASPLMHITPGPPCKTRHQVVRFV